jgi:hypothetical protein
MIFTRFYKFQTVALSTTTSTISHNNNDNDKNLSTTTSTTGRLRRGQQQQQIESSSSSSAFLIKDMPVIHIVRTQFIAMHQVWSPKEDVHGVS